jgi:hypothetical protein
MTVRRPPPFFCVPAKAQTMDLPQAHRLLKVSFDTPLEEVRRVYRQAARRCHPDSQTAEVTETVDFAMLSQAFKMIEKDRQAAPPASQLRIASGLGDMPICEQTAPASDNPKKVLSFVTGDGTVVRQEITVRMQQGKNAIMTMDLPPEESEDAGGAAEDVHEEIEYEQEAETLVDAETGTSLYLHKDSSRELSFPHPSSTACRIPF